jgi:NAD(P)-dependent dehydrogenase (short-subunit alcohol dehydrogenase family)
MLKGKIALVTGGGRGIGKAIALAYAQNGADVIVTARTKKEIEEVAAECRKLGRKAQAYSMDITIPEQIRSVKGSVQKEFGGLDILVNNAGDDGKRVFLWEYDDSEWRRMIDVNLTGTFLVTKAFLPVMFTKNKGRVIIISSQSAKQGTATNAAYSACKHGQIGITRSLASELGALGLREITVNAICPGTTDTLLMSGPGGLLDQIGKQVGADRETVLNKYVLPRSIQQRLIKPDEVAAMALFLASDASSAITGQAINVCGGAVFH